MVHLLTLTWPVSRPGMLVSAAAPMRAGARPRRQATHISALPAVKIALTALALLSVGALIKYMPIFIWPVLLAAACRCLPSWRQRCWLALGSGLTCLVLVALAYAPFWQGWDTLHNVQDRQAIFTVSWLHGLSWLLTIAGVSDAPARTVAALAGLALLLAGTAWAAWRAWKQPERVVSICFWLLVWIIFACNPTTQAWYFVWPLAIGALQPWRKRTVLAMNLCACAGLLAYVVSSFVIPILGQ
jgi:hypothetical protein